MAKNNSESEIPAINLIGNGTIITGDITSNGDIRIDGILTGNLSAKGKIVVGESGKLRGDISCKNADVSGLVEGKIVVAELLSMKSSSTITGEIFISRLAIEPGCYFNATCRMEQTAYSSTESKVDKSK
jgi:cytoskeletal protein CcmA (bactofilin family)